jgi:hypothetical protein
MLTASGIIFSHATNDCNVFRRQIQSTINEGRLIFQEMQVDTQPFPINIIELASKKSCLGRKWLIKAKAKTSSLVILTRRVYHKEELLGKLRTGRLTSSEAATGRLSRTAERSSLTRASRIVRHLRADGSTIKQMVRMTQPDSPPMAIGVVLHTK